MWLSDLNNTLIGKAYSVETDSASCFEIMALADHVST